MGGVSASKSRTPLTYYGGKQRLAAQIVALMPPHRVYLEPFAGGAAVLFAKPRAPRDTLNDIDGRVMRFWRALRDRPDERVAATAATPYSREEWNLCRERPDADDDIEAARRFLVWIDQSFSRGGHRLVAAVDPVRPPRPLAGRRMGEPPREARRGRAPARGRRPRERRRA